MSLSEKIQSTAKTTCVSNSQSNTANHLGWIQLNCWVWSIKIVTVKWLWQWNQWGCMFSFLLPAFGWLTATSQRQQWKENKKVVTVSESDSQQELLLDGKTLVPANTWLHRQLLAETRCPGGNCRTTIVVGRQVLSHTSSRAYSCTQTKTKRCLLSLGLLPVSLFCLLSASPPCALSQLDRFS